MSTSRAPHAAAPAPSEPTNDDVRAEHSGHSGHSGPETVQPQPSADGAPISRVIVMDQALPRPLATQRVEIRRITIAPGHASGLHVHNGPVFGSIETGSAVYRIEGGPQTPLGPGDVFYEPEGVRIARFDAGEEGVTFLGYFLLAEGVDAGLVFPEG